MTFVTRRSLDTGDNEQDFLLKTDEVVQMSVAYRKTSAEWVHHDFRGHWILKFDSTSDQILDSSGIDADEM